MSSIDSKTLNLPIPDAATYRPGNAEAAPHASGPRSRASAAHASATNGVGAIDATGPVDATQAAHGPSTVVTSPLPPPMAPQVKFSPNAEAAWTALAAELNGVMARAAKLEMRKAPPALFAVALSAQAASRAPAAHPASSAPPKAGAGGTRTTPNPSDAPPATGVTPHAAVDNDDFGVPMDDHIFAQTMAMAQQLEHMTSAQMLGMFLLLHSGMSKDQAQTEDHGASITSAMRQADLEEQKKSNDAAAKKIAAAMKKIKKLKAMMRGFMIASIVLAVVLAGVMAGIMAMVAVAVAAAIGFVVAAAIGGAKKGNGFDVDKGLEGASYAADIMSACTGLYAIFKQVGQTVAKQGLKEMMKEISQLTAKQASKQAAREAAEEGGKKAAEKTTQQVLQTMMKDMSHLAAKEGTDDVATTAAKQGSKSAAKTAVGETTDNVAKEGGEQGIKLWAVEGTEDISKKTITQTVTTAASDTYHQGLSLTSRALIVGGAQGGFQGGQKVAQAVGERDIAHDQLDGETQTLMGKMWERMAEEMQQNFKVYQMMIQSDAEAFSTSIDKIFQMMNSKHASMTQAGNRLR